MTDTGHEFTVHPAPADLSGAQAQVLRLQTQLRRLHLLIGEQLAATVTDERLDIDVANGMLEVFGMPGLPRRWRVRISLPMVCEVTAASELDAFDAAAEAIENAVHATVTGAAIDIDFDGREDVHARSGEVDTEALGTDWPDQHLSD